MLRNWVFSFSASSVALSVVLDDEAVLVIFVPDRVDRSVAYESWVIVAIKHSPVAVLLPTTS